MRYKRLLKFCIRRYLKLKSIGRGAKFFLLSLIFIVHYAIAILQKNRDVTTGLRTKTQAGRPNWEKVFQKIRDENHGKVTVFYCGNPFLAKTLRSKCENYGFDFRKEVF